MNLREQILGNSDLPKEAVEIPEWGVTVHVRTMTGKERDAWEQSLATGNGKVDISNIRARLAARTVVDETGTRVFNDEDAEALGGKNAGALERIVRVAQRLNKLTDGDLEAAKGN